jgi:uncharacterized protein YceK
MMPFFKNSMKTLLVISTAIILTGCAPTVLNKPGATQGEYSSDMAQCEYDAVKYAGTSDPSMRTAIGAGIEQGLRQRDLKLACMKSKGWSPQA